MKQHIVWIHGWGMSAQAWGDTSAFLPGFEHHFATYEGCRIIADFHRALLQKLQGLKGGVTVIGWSMGGMLALELMLRAEAVHADKANSNDYDKGNVMIDYNDNINNVRTTESQLEGYEVADGLVLGAIVIVGGTLRFANKQRSLGWPVRVVERMRSQLLTQPEEILRQFKQSIFSEADRARADWKPTLEQELLTQKSDFCNEGLIEGLTYLIETDLTSRWNTSRIACQNASPNASSNVTPKLTGKAPQNASQDFTGLPRLLWMHGEDDPICPLGAIPDLPQANRRIFPGGGHAPFLTDRDQFYEHLRGFLHAYQ